MIQSPGRAASSPAASLDVADRDLAARIARVWVLQHRPVKSALDVSRLIDDLEAWHGRTRDLLVRRFGDHEVAGWFDDANGPLVHPSDSMPLAEQARLVRSQAAMRMRWLVALRAELPHRVAASQSTEVAGFAEACTDVVVLRAPRSSPTAGAIVSALEALGEGQPIVVELGDDIGRLEESVPPGAAVIVIVDREHRSQHPSAVTLLALGWAAGAVGRDRVLAVLGPLVEDQPAFEPFNVVPARVRARWRAEVVAWAAAATRPGAQRAQ